MTRVGKYNEIKPQPSGNPLGSGYISLDIPPLVPIPIQHCVSYVIFRYGGHDEKDREKFFKILSIGNVLNLKMFVSTNLEIASMKELGTDHFTLCDYFILLTKKNH